ncbi:GM22384 [Drosophila sechellia]|uniref:GM22384 n=1 Tax=Drosophila sechellia TaxID=7238 RepID=B4IAS2_DROSE|nr:GM22384 [Drosophila sechellia]
MTSIIPPGSLVPQAQGVEAAVPIWLKMDWSPEMEQGIYKDWGTYYSRRRRREPGALELGPAEFTTLYRRSQSRRKNAQADGALKDSLEAIRLLKNLQRSDAPINLEVCDALYELNRLENAKAELHDNTRLFTGNKTKMFEQRLVVVDENIEDACGPSMTQYISDKEKLIVHLKEVQNKYKPDTRPLWKILKEQEKCDVLSIPEIEKILEARSPMYNIRYQKFTNKKLMDKFRQEYLFRVQYQTRRNMISALRSIRYLRKTKSLTKLTSYVEEVMGDYVVKKTNRIMPWKFEFINEVYNILALAYVDQYTLPKNFRYAEKNALLRLLRFPMDKSKEVKHFVFGDRTTHQGSETVDPALTKSRLIGNRFENRMNFAQYPIEKSYLLHQMAEIHLKSHRFDECCFSARKSIEEAKKCNSYIWQFLCYLLIIKANAALHKVERTSEALDMALKIAKELKEKHIHNFLTACIHCNEEEFIVKKQSIFANSRRESEKSVYSSLSVRHSE